MPDHPNGPLVPVIAVLSITMTADGQVKVNANGDPLPVFNALGAATSQLAAYYAEQAQRSVQIAPAELINRLPKG